MGTLHEHVLRHVLLFSFASPSFVPPLHQNLFFFFTYIPVFPFHTFPLFIVFTFSQ